MTQWVTDLFKSIDDMDTDKFASFLDEDVIFTFGNNPTAVGLDATKEAVSGFFSSINGLSHELLNTWHDGDAVIVQGVVTYTRKDDKKVAVPFCDVFKMKDDKIAQYLIYMDVTPLFA